MRIRLSTSDSGSESESESDSVNGTVSGSESSVSSTRSVASHGTGSIATSSSDSSLSSTPRLDIQINGVVVHSKSCDGIKEKGDAQKKWAWSPKSPQKLPISHSYPNKLDSISISSDPSSLPAIFRQSKSCSPTPINESRPARMTLSIPVTDLKLPLIKKSFSGASVATQASLRDHQLHEVERLREISTAERLREADRRQHETRSIARMKKIDFFQQLSIEGSSISIERNPRFLSRRPMGISVHTKTQVKKSLGSLSAQESSFFKKKLTSSSTETSTEISLTRSKSLKVNPKPLKVDSEPLLVPASLARHASL